MGLNRTKHMFKFAFKYVLRSGKQKSVANKANKLSGLDQEKRNAETNLKYPFKLKLIFYILDPRSKN